MAMTRMDAVRWLMTAAALAATSTPVAGQEAARGPGAGVVSVAVGYAADVDELRRWDATVDGMTRTGELVVVSRRADRSLPGRTHEYLAQFFEGVRVHGGGVSRQLDRGVTVSLFGALHTGIDVETAPALTVVEAAGLLVRRTGAAVVDRLPLEPVVLPLFGGAYEADLSPDPGRRPHLLRVRRRRRRAAAGGGVRRAVRGRHRRGIPRRRQEDQHDAGGRAVRSPRPPPARRGRHPRRRLRPEPAPAPARAGAVPRPAVDVERHRGRRRQRLGRPGGGRRPCAHGLDLRLLRAAARLGGPRRPERAHRRHREQRLLQRLRVPGRRSAPRGPASTSSASARCRGTRTRLSRASRCTPSRTS